MKAIVTYKENGWTKTMSAEAADFETIKKAINQWRVNELRVNDRHLIILDIKCL